MKIQAIGDWSSTSVGNVSDGQVLDVEDGFATHLVERGYARFYETKPEPVAPLGVAGSSQAARPAPKKKTSRKYEVKG